MNSRKGISQIGTVEDMIREELEAKESENTKLDISERKS
jgi:hypothetical protein